MTTSFFFLLKTRTSSFIFLFRFIFVVPNYRYRFLVLCAPITPSSRGATVAKRILFFVCSSSSFLFFFLFGPLSSTVGGSATATLRRPTSRRPNLCSVALKSGIDNLCTLRGLWAIRVRHRSVLVLTRHIFPRDATSHGDGEDSVGRSVTEAP